MHESAVPLYARLHHLHLSSPKPEGLAGFYAEVFSMAVHKHDGVWICRGPERCLIFSSGPPNSLVAAGYAVADAGVLRGLQVRAAAHLVDPSPIDIELFQPGAAALRDPDGNRIAYGLPSALSSFSRLEAPPARLQHLVVGSTDVERLVRFYTDIVGLRESDEVRDDQGEIRTCFLRTDDEHHSFAMFKTPETRLDHHCYELPDWNSIRNWGDRLAALGVPIKWGPGRHGPGNNLFMFFHDPDGNWVELSTELEIVSALRPVGIWPHEERTLNTWGRGLLRS